MTYSKIVITRSSEPQYKSEYDIYLTTKKNIKEFVRVSKVKAYATKTSIGLLLDNKNRFSIKSFDLSKTITTNTEKKINTSIFPLLNDVIKDNVEYSINFSYNMKDVLQKKLYLEDTIRKLPHNNYLVLLNPIYIDNHEFIKNETSDKYAVIIIQKNTDDSITLNFTKQLGSLENAKFVHNNINIKVEDLNFYLFFTQGKKNSFANTLALSLGTIKANMIQANIGNYYVVEVKHKLTGK